MSAAEQRKALVLALHVLGHTQPEHVIRNAEGIADELARIEAAPGNEEIGRPLMARKAAARLAEYLPAVWEFAIAGHQGGG